MGKSSSGGRPPKFNEPRSPITVTLPHRTLRQLAAINPDRAKAIVACVDAAAKASLPAGNRVELITVAPNTALIVVGPNRSLGRIPWLRLIEIAPAPFLICMPSGSAVASLEVALLDLIEHLPPEESSEKALLMEPRQRLTHQRRKDTVAKVEILLLETQ
jgi:hypothetical protein